MMRLKQQIPNLFTLGNLLCGCLAIKYAFEWDLIMAVYLLLLGSVFDFLDGFVARILKVPSEMGKQLDSLADLVSFGVAPGIMMFQLLRLFIFIHAVRNNENVYDTLDTLSYAAFLIPLLSAYRLAKFNLDTRQTDKFIGLPTPANTLFFCGIILSLFMGNHLLEIGKEIFMHEKYEGLSQLYLEKYVKYPMNYYHVYFVNPFVITGTIALFSILLIAEIKLFALKFKNFGWAENQIRYVFLGISAALLIIFQHFAIPFIIILYLLLSILNNYTLKQ